MNQNSTKAEQPEQVGDRLVALMSRYDLTAYQFAKTLGYEGPQKLYKLLQNKSKPGYETLMDVLDHYPQLRAEWLMRGVGLMMADEEPVAAGATPKKQKATADGPVSKQLAAQGIELPAPPTPSGSYDSVRVLGGVAYVAMQFPFVDGQPALRGRLGKELTTEQGREAAQQCALNVLAQLNNVLGLDQVLGLNHIEVQLATTAGWDEFTRVLDGASDLFLEALGAEAGRHARTQYSVERLPADMPVALTATFTLKPSARQAG